MPETPKTLITRSGRVLDLPTPEEDARIAAGIAADSDTYELGAAEFERLRRPGRPRAAVKRPMLSMRADPDAVSYTHLTLPTSDLV